MYTNLSYITKGFLIGCQLVQNYVIIAVKKKKKKKETITKETKNTM